MPDVFLSFSTHQIADQDKPRYHEWVAGLKEELGTQYRDNFTADLDVWIYTQAANNGPGDNFIKAIDEAMPGTPIFLMVVDPGYLQSSQSLDEIVKYKAARTGAPLHVLKVVRKQGDQADAIRDLVDGNIVEAFFCKKSASGLELEYDRTSVEYKEAVGTLVVKIRSFLKDEDRRKKRDILFQRLGSWKTQPLAYVALGNAVLRDDRISLINQLVETLQRKPEVPGVMILPDALAVGQLISRESLGWLLLEENDYREECLQAMIDASFAYIIPLEYNSNNEAQELEGNIGYQLKVILARALTDQQKRPVHILSNCPQNLRPTNPFVKLIDPGVVMYRHIKLSNDQPVNDFVDAFVAALASLFVVAPLSVIRASKAIYLVENTETDPSLNLDDARLAQEEGNRRSFRYLLEKEGFTLIPDLEPDSADGADMAKALEHHIFWLKNCDGVIIYRGIRENKNWQLQKQGHIYKALIDLGAKKDLSRAVYIDPLQSNRERADYAYFKYEVILKDPPDLTNFLCKI